MYLKTRCDLQGWFIAVLLLGLLHVGNAGAQVTWSNSAENPVLRRGSGSQWDAGLVLSPTVIRSGDSLKMWYTGAVDLANTASAAIGYATSADGITWTKYSGNPVMRGRSAEWDGPGVLNPSVIQDGDTLRMWYLGGRGPDGSDIGYATSVDGVNWERRSAPVMTLGGAGEWNAGTMLPGPVVREEGVFKMWFSGGVGGIEMANPNIRTGIGYATSVDGIAWSIYDDPATTSAPYEFSDPVLNHGDDGEWDSHEMFTPSVVVTDSGYEMWYSGWRWQSNQFIGYATSADGLRWVKHGANPIGTWASGLVYPSVILDNAVYRMWTSRWIGFATSVEYATSAAMTSTEDRSASRRVRLDNVHPNPFDREATIQFEVAQVTGVTVEVYNLLGQQMVALVNDIHPPGRYSVSWDGKDASGAAVASGVYVVRLETDESRLVRTVVHF